MKDLIVTVSDGQQEKVLKALLPRIPAVSKTAEFSFDVIQNPGKDAGSYNDSHELLRPFINQYRFALIVLDFEGTGVEHLPAEEVEKNIQELMGKNGWKDRNVVIVIRPELENWIWMDNRHVEEAIAWEKEISLYDWARQEGLLAEGSTKPKRPKEAMEKALRLSGTPPSAAIYGKIASKASYLHCTDIAFNSLVQQIKIWFPLH